MRFFSWQLGGLLAAVCFIIPHLSAAEASTPGAKSVKITARLVDSSSKELLQAFNQTPLPPGLPPGATTDDNLSLAAVFSEEQTSTLLKSLGDVKDTEMVSLPSVFARSGRVATLKMAQEVRYPSEPAKSTNAASTTFQTSEVGVTMTALPTIGSDGYSIELEINPRLSWISGYSIPGQSRVDFPSTRLTRLLQEIPAEYPSDENTQPVIASREAKTQLTMYDGSTVLLGGLKSKDPRTGEVRTFAMLVTASIVPASETR